MKKLLSCMALIMTMVTLTGCEWGSSGSDSSWSDSYSWVNFAGAYRPPSGKTYLVSSFGGGSSSSGTTTTTNDITYINHSMPIGTGDGNTTDFGGGYTMNHPVRPGSVTVTSESSGGITLVLVDQGGILVDSNGANSGSINYDTGTILASFFGPPGDGENVVVAYQYDADGGGATEPDLPGSGGDGNVSKIYSLILSQTGQHLTAVDNNGLEYSGVISGLSQSGGDRDGNTRGSVTANFSIKSASGMEIVGVLTGFYKPPSDEDVASEDEEEESTVGMIVGKAEEEEVETVPTTGSLINRQMQGTYISTSGSTGDVQGEAGGIQVTIGG